MLDAFHHSQPGACMRPLGWIGVVLIVIGVAGFATGGFSYTKEKHSVEMGPLKMEAKEKGFVPRSAAIALLVVGAVMVGADVMGRKKT